MKKTSILLTLSTAFLFSCGGIESYQKKMERYTARPGEQTVVPEIKSASFAFSNTKNIKRAPASVATTESSITNKKLYFLSLYTQYESLKGITNNPNASDVSICPAFHTGLVTYKEKNPKTDHFFEKKYSYNKALMSDEKYVSSHPELYLPVSKEGTTPRVIDVINSMKDGATDSAITEVMQNAINIHLSKTYTELRELCDFGSSNNYYIYENLTTHVKNNKFSATTDNMNILLKTTIFSNRALLTSLSKDKPIQIGRSIASEKRPFPYSDEVIARLNVPWANDYFKFIKETKY